MFNVAKISNELLKVSLSASKYAGNPARQSNYFFNKAIDILVENGVDRQSIVTGGPKRRANNTIECMGYEIGPNIPNYIREINRPKIQ